MKYLFLSMFLMTAAAVIAEPPAPGSLPPPLAPASTNPPAPGPELQPADQNHREPGERDLGPLTPEKIAKLTKAAETLEAKIKAHPENAELNIKLGFTYTRLQKVEDAQRAFENAARLDPKREISFYMLGLIYEKKGLKDKAVEAWKACLANSGADDEHMRDMSIKHLHHLTGAR